MRPGSLFLAGDMELTRVIGRRLYGVGLPVVVGRRRGLCGWLRGFFLMGVEFAQVRERWERWQSARLARERRQRWERRQIDSRRGWLTGDWRRSRPYDRSGRCRFKHRNSKRRNGRFVQLGTERLASYRRCRVVFGSKYGIEGVRYCGAGVVDFDGSLDVAGPLIEVREGRLAACRVTKTRERLFNRRLRGAAWCWSRRRFRSGFFLWLVGFHNWRCGLQVLRKLCRRSVMA